jgi:protein deglycase
MLYLVTSRGPGTAILFSLKLVEILYDREKAQDLAKALLVEYNI